MPIDGSDCEKLEKFKTRDKNGESCFGFQGRKEENIKNPKLSLHIFPALVQMLLPSDSHGSPFSGPSLGISLSVGLWAGLWLCSM